MRPSVFGISTSQPYLNPRALLLTEGQKSSGEPWNKVSSHWFSLRIIKSVSDRRIEFTRASGHIRGSGDENGASPHAVTWLQINQRRCSHKAVFNWVSKVISELLWFCITSLSDWFKVLAPLLIFNQSEVKPKPIVARACTFPRALCRLRVITSSFDWFTGLSPSFWMAKVISLVLVLRHSFENRSNVQSVYLRD